MAENYDVTIATVRPGTHPQALAVLEKTLTNDPSLLACWYSEIGALNSILIIRKSADAAAAGLKRELRAVAAICPMRDVKFRNLRTRRAELTDALSLTYRRDHTYARSSRTISA